MVSLQLPNTKRPSHESNGGIDKYYFLLHNKMCPHLKDLYNSESQISQTTNCCCCLVIKSCLTLRPHGLQFTRLLYPWDFPGKNTEVGYHCLPQTTNKPDFKSIQWKEGTNGLSTLIFTLQTVPYSLTTCKKKLAQIQSLNFKNEI